MRANPLGDGVHAQGLVASEQRKHGPPDQLHLIIS
jgi:hypothetical protein